MAYVKLIELVRKFDSGVIELPLMQRDYVARGQGRRPARLSALGSPFPQSFLIGL
jgi:hypothetical protein